MNLVIDFILNDKYHLRKSATLGFGGTIINGDQNTSYRHFDV